MQIVAKQLYKNQLERKISGEKIMKYNYGLSLMSKLQDDNGKEKN